MTTLTITPKVADKTARFKGTVAAGEHVAVTIKGGAEWLGEDGDRSPVLRVIDCTTRRTLAVFPYWTEDNRDDWPEDVSEPDAWATSGGDDDEEESDLVCTLNLNTIRMVAAARHMLRVPVLFVLGDSENPRTLYFCDRYEVGYWPERIGDTVPYDLDRWPKRIDEWQASVDLWTERMDNMKLSAEYTPRTETELGKTTITLNDGNDAQDTVVVIHDGADGEVTPAQLNAAIAGVNASIGNVAAGLDAHASNGNIHVTAAQKTAWTAKYGRPAGGIPKSDLAAGVQASLALADTALQAHQPLDAYVNGGVYDSNAKKILLKHGSTTIAEIDATAFIKDGMVDGVEVSGGNLVISFNTDAGIEDIEIPLTDIFNPANYYDKTAADGRFVQKEAGKGLFSGSYNDLRDRPTFATVATSGSYNDLSDKPTIPAPVPVDPALATQGAAADAKAVGDALRSGFSPWEFSGIPSGYTVTLLEGEEEGGVDFWITGGWYGDGKLQTYGESVEDATKFSFSLVNETGTGILATVTATRRRITPTKTSQLTNDGDGTHAFVTSNDLRYRLAVPGEWMWVAPDGLTNFNITSIQPDTSYGTWDVTYTSDQTGTATVTIVVAEGADALDISFYAEDEQENTYWVELTRASLPGHLADRACNRVEVSGNTTLTLPAANPGRMRDLYVRLSVSAGSTVTWAVAQGESWDAAGAPPASFAEGTHLYRVTEVAPGVWHAEDMLALAGLEAALAGKQDKYEMVAVTQSNGTLTVAPYTVATYTAGTTAAAFTVAVGAGTTGMARDCELVIDCTATGAVAPTVTWPATFHPRTDAGTDFACEAGVRNVYFISEYATGEFAVGGWQETAGGNA